MRTASLQTLQLRVFSAEGEWPLKHSSPHPVPLVARAPLSTCSLTFLHCDPADLRVRSCVGACGDAWPRGLWEKPRDVTARAVRC
ncbi:hypothetical protein SRHO_G00239610 [Serrasalmus rhombeus]